MFSGVVSFREYSEYIKEVLKRDFDEILLGFGNGFVGNKKVAEEKENLNKLLKPYAKKLVELVDVDENYKALKTILKKNSQQKIACRLLPEMI